LSHTYEGKASDKSLAELTGYTLPPGSSLDQDRGFQGFCLQDVTIVQPKKTPRGGELTPPERATNRRIASIRIRIEHAIGGVKRDRIVKPTFKGVWTTAVNFAPLPPPDTRPGQYPRHHRQSDDNPGRHGPGDCGARRRRTARASPA